MKKLLALILALLLVLSACGKTPDDTEPSQTEPVTTAPTEPSESEPPTTESTEATEPTEPAPVYRPDLGMYQPESPIESDTGGAVKYFLPQVEGVHDIAIINDGLLLFSEAEEGTVLTLCREETEAVSVTIPVLYAGDGSGGVEVGPQGVSYYDSGANAMVFLDTSLQEVNRVELLAEMTGTSVVSDDWAHIYYFTPTALMDIDLTTGISRVRKECAFDSQQPVALFFDGAVLECFILDGETSQLMFLSTETGETLFMSETMPFLNTEGQWYFAEWYGEEYPQLLFGQRGEKPNCLEPLFSGVGVWALPEFRSAVITDTVDAGITLDYYDLDTGLRSASLALDGLTLPWSLRADAEQELIWFLAEDDEGTVGLYCWDYTLSPTGDETDYTTPYYSPEEPDWEGLARIEEQAKTMGKTYGVNIWVYEDAISAPPSDFTFEAAYQVPLYEQYLPLLEKGLGAFPKDFLKKLGTSSANGKVTICLVAGAYGDNELGALSSADGVHYMLNGSHYVVLVMNGFMEGSLYHELFHAIDTYVFNRVNIYDRWDELNPAGFEYDNDYLENQYREDYHYLEDDTRAFIDLYSMSYAKEDRARIMEYAMQEGMESYFTSPIMQSKLKTLSEGIRKAFGLEKYKEPLVWEQYLK